MQTKKQSLRDRLRKRNKLGFSLVELIVVIAIMAVLVAVLAPSLLSYVERSRAQKDESAMGEVTNAVLLALSDADVYDELLTHSVKDNVSCYIDVSDETNAKSEKVSTKDGSNQYIFDDASRVADETPYYAAGNMRGVTITFTPNVGTKTASYQLYSGSINKFYKNEGAIMEDCPTLYNTVRATVGDTIEQTSQTYRNSEYTIFIKMGSMGGAQADAQDAVQVYGQYNGTNLPSVADHAARRAGKLSADGTPIAPSVTVNTAGKIEETLVALNGTIYDKSNPTSLAFESPADLNAFQAVTISDGTNTTIVDSKYYTLTQGSTIATLHSGKDAQYDCLSELENGQYTITIVSAHQFASIEISVTGKKLEKIPEGGIYYVGVTSDFTGDYSGATATYTAGQPFPEISNGDVYVYGDYEYRYNMYNETLGNWCPFEEWWYYQTISEGWGIDYIGIDNPNPTSPIGVINGKEVTCAISAFFLHTEIERAPVLPDSITNMSYAFSRCENLKYVPNMPKNTDEMSYCFFECFELSESPVLLHCEKLEVIEGAYWGSGLTILPVVPDTVSEVCSAFGYCEQLVDASYFVIPASVTDTYAMFSNCTNLQKAPIIPAHVENVWRTFRSCTSLTGTITINCNTMDEYSLCFEKVDMSKITLAGSCDADIKQNIANTGKNGSQVTIID